MSRRPGWLDGRVDALVAALADLGMSMSRPAAAQLIEERTTFVAAQLGVSAAAAQRHLTDDVVLSLAQTMVVSFANETPGADVLEAPRSAALPVPILARTVSALSEAINVRLYASDDVAELRESIAQVSHALSALGQVAADQDPATLNDKAVVMMPPGLLNRAARYLEATASLVESGVVPERFDPRDAGAFGRTLREDATALRFYAGG